MQADPSRVSFLSVFSARLLPFPAAQPPQLGAGLAAGVGRRVGDICLERADK